MLRTVPPQCTALLTSCLANDNRTAHRHPPRIMVIRICGGMSHVLAGQIKAWCKRRPRNISLVKHHIPTADGTQGFHVAPIASTDNIGSCFMEERLQSEPSHRGDDFKPKSGNRFQ